jgi:putative tricarboxylic transport membrane protein
MGPGYFPALCGIAMALLGAGAIVKGLSAKIPNPLSMGNVEPLFLILASIISFGLLVERAGLVVATFVCIFFACLRRVFTNPIEVLLIFIVLTTFNVVVFVYALGIVIPVFWWDN